MARPKKVVTRTDLWNVIKAVVETEAFDQLDALEDEKARSIGSTLSETVLQAEELAWQLVEREREVVRKKK